ncbi:MAG: hypothetical protein CM1200mP6_01300 [Anaerolineaceae bacterium]|nr:MAG: hypothetical protein CM1200mP6_01300 [Anaerolineaceae bacterium]
MQCGFCTPGFLLTVQDLLSRNPDPTDTEIREELSGNICRCTGYQSIIAAVKKGCDLYASRIIKFLNDSIGKQLTLLA